MGQIITDHKIKQRRAGAGHSVGASAGRSDLSITPSSFDVSRVMGVGNYNEHIIPNYIMRGALAYMGAPKHTWLDRDEAACGTVSRRSS